MSKGVVCPGGYPSCTLSNADKPFLGAEFQRRLQMVTTKIRVALVVGLLMTCVPLFAHHGSATYDTQKVVVLKDATITKFIWANPHSIAMFDVKDDKGNVIHWAAEAGSPSALSLIGWTKNSLRPGDVVTVYTFQSKTGNPVGRLNKIVLTDGTTLRDSQLGDAESKDKSEKPY
jgi:Family of unknown function (DUF6152)